MGFRPGAFATVFGVESKTPKVTQLRLSVSRKIPGTTDYEVEFSGFVSAVGEAAPKALKLKDRDRIKIGDIDVRNTYNKEKNVTYWNCTMFNFELANFNEHKSAPTEDYSEIIDIEGDEEGLPF